MLGQKEKGKNVDTHNAVPLNNLGKVIFLCSQERFFWRSRGSLWMVPISH